METEFAVSLGSQRWTLPADGDTITLGRGSNADIRLPSDDQISRIHARLNRTDTTWTLVDESRNGTALNGRRLAAPTPLTDNDQIHIGRSVLTFHEQPAQAPPPSAPAAPAQTGLGGTAALTGPGETPAQAGPGVTPAPAGPGVAPAQAGSGGGFDAAAQPGPPGALGNNPFLENGASVSEVGYTPPDDQPAWGDQPPAPGPQASERAEWVGAPTDPRDGGAALRDGEMPRGAAPNEQPVLDDQIIGGSREEWIRSREAGERRTGAPEDARGESAGSVQGAPGERDARSGRGGGDDAARGERDGSVQGAAGEQDARGGRGEAEGGVAWAAYPSADNPEPARSPWSVDQRPPLTQPEGGQANWSESAGWPESAFEQERPSPQERRPEPVRRKPETTELAEAGHVRLIRVLLVAAAVLGLGLVINLVATFFQDGTGGTLRWLVPPVIALIAAMVVALLDGTSSEERPAGGRLDVPVVIAIVAVLFGVGVGGFALTAGVEYVAGYITGKESGADRLIKPVAKTGAGLTVTVENVTYTSHFTRVEVAVSNGSDQSMSFPLEDVAFTGADGNSLEADGFRSDWADSIAAGSVERGTITCKGHLPEGLTAATLTLKSGDLTFTVPGIALSN